MTATNGLSGHEHFDEIKLLFDIFVKSCPQN